MDFLFLWLLSSGSYVALVWGLARGLPARAHPLLRGLHWLTTGLGLLAGLGPLLTLGHWAFQSVPLLCGLLLVSGVRAGVRARRRLPRVVGLSAVQAVLVGMAAPLLLTWATDSPSVERAYSDGRFIVTIESYDFPGRDDLNYSRIELYRTHGLVFEEYLGQIMTYPISRTVPALPTWWRGVSALSFDTGSNRGRVRHDDGAVVPFILYERYRGSTGRPPFMPPPDPTPPPPDDHRAYSYVEAMPQLPGGPGQALTTELIRAIRARLVLPPDARPGQVFVSLVIEQTGDVREVRMEKGLTARTDSAVLAAARQLPRFIPGRLYGRPVRVEVVIPLLVPGPTARP